MNKYYHLILTLLLASSVAAVNLNEPATLWEEAPEPRNTYNGSLPTFEGIELNESSKTVYLDSMSLRQKIGLMIVSYEYRSDLPSNTVVGGIHLTTKKNISAFQETVREYERDRPIEPLFTADLEGCINPFRHFQTFQSTDQIQTVEEARRVGVKHGELLQEVGADINFAPVADLRDTIWHCRSFNGSVAEVSSKVCGYIRGLESRGIMATVKHYPGDTLTGKDPHKDTKQVKISRDEIQPFKTAKDCGVTAVMPSHQTSSGIVNSGKLPADASPKIINKVRENFTGLVVSDAISMDGLSGKFETKKEKYIAVFKAGNDIILNLFGGRNDTAEMIDIVAEAVRGGKIERRNIDRSVTRLMNARGWTVIDKNPGTDKVYPPWKIKK